MSIDRSRDTPPVPSDVTRRPEDIDPWDEFLSEESAELQVTGASPPTRVASRIHMVDLQPSRRDASETRDALALTGAGEREPDEREPSPVAPRDTGARPAGTLAASVALSQDEYAHPVPRLVTRPVLPAREDVPPRTSAASPAAELPAGESPATDRLRPGPQTLRNAISVRDVIGRQVAVQWAEAVAVVQRLCVRLDNGGPSDLPVPDLTGILLTAEGDVAVRPGAGGDPDAAALGRTLNALLGTSSTPLPLRLFATASSVSGRYHTVALYANALSYYATSSDAGELIRALYARAMDASTPAAPPPLRRTIASAELPLSAAKKRTSAIPGWLVAALIGVVVGGVSSVLFLQVSASPPIVAAGSKAAVVAAPVPRDDWQLGSVLSDTGERFVPPAPVRPVPDRTSGMAAVAPLPNAITAPPPPAAAPSMPPRPPSEPARTPIAAGQVPTPPVVAPRVVPVDTKIYSAADQDVEVPVLLTQLPTPSPSFSPDDQPTENVYEMVVNPEGRVETVRLLNRPARLTDMNDLQPLKLARFRPARRNGQAVSYRFVLRVTSP